MAETFPILVAPAWLREHLDAVRVLDCTTHMTPQAVGPSRIESGRPDFDAAHIPGARHVDMVDDLSDPDGAFAYTLPSAEQIGRLLGGLGITRDDHVVLYTSTHLMVATRAWYVLRALGHERVSVLDGGLDAWRAAGYPVEATSDAADGAHARDAEETAASGRGGSPSTYTAAPDPSRYATKTDVAAATADARTVVVNALSAEQHAGTGGAHYGRPGRIPGSVSVPTARLLSRDGKSFAPLETIRRQFAAQGVTPGARVITYCGGGIAATVDAFALALIGHDDWAVYDNSLLEWSSDPENEMQTG
ncbi:sulfurtransferase [Cumulibacter manganitolerans]|uniref:sulfurtransferase n=1 Tax=Cumulibacter manganitolerans TaxID=1884992 RepID=UPI001885AC10|nr:rhodanese-like domain-containing protein [Cumulibacter manganitolerans]